MKAHTIYVRVGQKIEEREVFGFKCPCCSQSYWADQEELDTFETYTCPMCEDDIYFEDSTIEGDF